MVSTSGTCSTFSNWCAMRLMSATTSLLALSPISRPLVSSASQNAVEPITSAISTEPMPSHSRLPVTCSSSSAPSASSRPSTAAESSSSTANFDGSLPCSTASTCVQWPRVREKRRAA
ncbi:MAG TPA: hypothetical protein VHE37_07645 [Nevskiaceae bacterium]|nr:hypothetical protein [Nevskiaceae bacterium]